MRDVYADNPDAARYAGFWIRVAANLLDALWMAAVSQVTFIGFGRTVIATPKAVSASTTYNLTAFGPAIVVVAFWMVKGATPGKMLCGLRIVDEPTGGRLTALAVRRTLRDGDWSAVDCAALGYLYLIIDPRKQGLHDKVRADARACVGADRPDQSARCICGQSVRGGGRLLALTAFSTASAMNA